MQKLFLLCSIILVMNACSSRDEAFCKCLKAGDELNTQSKKMLLDQSSSDERKKFKQLRKQKEEACRPYRTMDGPTMLEKKKACED